METLKEKTTTKIHQTEFIRVRNSKSPPKTSLCVRIGPNSTHIYTISPAKPFARRWEKFLSKRRQFKEHDSGVCYILKYLEDRKAWSVHTYYTRCDIILIFKLHRRTPLRLVLLYTVWKFNWRHTRVINMNRSCISCLLSVNYKRSFTKYFDDQAVVVILFCTRDI